ncbi:hypothetical protein GQ457_08G005800 [Hibiscus cannabinus]
MSGIMHKIGETLHMGGDNKKEEEKHKGEAQHAAAGHDYGGVEHKGEGPYDAGHGHGHGTTMTMTGTEYKGEVGHGNVQGEQHKEGFMDKIKDKIHGGETKEHGQDGGKKKKEKKKKREDGHESSSSSDSD